jgi:hypothetical protein
MSDAKKQDLLQQMAAIPTMERGKLSTYTFKERGDGAGPYHKLQAWQAGQNQTRYVPAAEVPAVQAALAGYQQYQQLTAAYAELVIQETRAGTGPAKKKRPAPGAASPKRRRSRT